MEQGNRKIELMRRRSARIAHRLAQTYGTPDLGNMKDPLDELVFIILSQMTTGPSYSRVFDRLKARVLSWDDLISLPGRTLRSLIRDAGLSNQKAPRLREIIKKIRQDFGSATLEPLACMPNEETEAYLTSLPGVGVKTAKCVMMYSLGRQVLPVDTHVRRVLIRLGILPGDISATSIHETAEFAVRAPDRYSVHVNGVVHGRKVCRALHPKCEACCLRRICRVPTQAISG